MFVSNKFVSPLNEVGHLRERIVRNEYHGSVILGAVSTLAKETDVIAVKFYAVLRGLKL